MKEEKPKEFIAAIKLLLTNGQILNPKFALAPLKHDEATTKPKLITAIKDVPINFTHLGQYAFTSRNRIFEMKKDWKGENDRYSKSKKADHRDNVPQPETFKDPVVYFTDEPRSSSQMVTCSASRNPACAGKQFHLGIVSRTLLSLSGMRSATAPRGRQDLSA